MRSTNFLPLAAALLAAPAAGTTVPPDTRGPQYIFANPDDVGASSYRIPTSRESAVLARRVLALTPRGVLSTVFPGGGTGTAVPDTAAGSESLVGMPVGLMDYVADCEDDGRGNPTILAINIATSFRNVRAGSNISLALSWTPKYPPEKRIELASYVPSWLGSWWSWLRGDGEEDGDGDNDGTRTKFSAANLPRFSLLGYLEPIPGADRESAVAECFVATHPDARYWLPGNRIHESEFVRLVVTGVYWIGGFGDRAYIGWIPVEEWRGVTREEWQGVRLPGEGKGWKEWVAEQMTSEEL